MKQGQVAPSKGREWEDFETVCEGAGYQLGIHVVLEAGNDNTNTSGISPARVAAAITVGAATIADGRVSFPITGKGQCAYFRTLSTNIFSLSGSFIDIFAPGQYITSSWTGGTNRTNISGTGNMISYNVTRTVVNPINGLLASDSEQIGTYPMSELLWKRLRTERWRNN
ncbi:hypothetical protein ARMGADRAFT_1034176 [Armillaria gallica]|uniref:Peptidase S8/S53 domain-containing protein n=1 Tax=Armillaria gallica TaxID=47427 RepID=A0A2H3CYT0_ARMGA|nr:hypothetical protein ARMGADRAFT_1034176 [Armillaria gallica]